VIWVQAGAVKGGYAHDEGGRCDAETAQHSAKLSVMPSHSPPCQRPLACLTTCNHYIQLVHSSFQAIHNFQDLLKLTDPRHERWSSC
jgi:hypothetical protein